MPGRMSYRTFKRVLGETNLERKCRWWFGISLAVLLTLSFYWYGKRTDQIVKDLNPRFIGPELVRAGWLEVHLAHLDMSGSEFLPDLVESSRDMGRKFKWDAILPADAFQGKIDEKFRPRDATEARWLAEWSAPVAAPAETAEADGKTDVSAALPSPAGRGEFHQRYVEEPDGRRSYQYYQPMRADPSCVKCHRHLIEVGRRPNLNAGDLIAMVRVTTDYDATADQI